MSSASNRAKNPGERRHLILDLKLCNINGLVGYVDIFVLKILK